jgi:hypothetical protein
MNPGLDIIDPKSIPAGMPGIEGIAGASAAERVATPVTLSKLIQTWIIFYKPSVSRRQVTASLRRSLVPA